MELQKIELQEVKDIVNGFLYKIDGFGFNDLKVSNETIDLYGGLINEIIIDINNS